MDPEKVLFYRRDEPMTATVALFSSSEKPTTNEKASTYPSFKQEWVRRLPQNVESTNGTISPPQKSLRELFQQSFVSRPASKAKASNTPENP